jgi:hypothetical protein
VRLQIDTKNAAPSIRIGFTDQRLTAHGGLIVWSHFLRQKKFRQQLREVLPHDPTSPNAYDPTDVALGYVGGILCGADKLSRVAWLQSDGWIQVQSATTRKRLLPRHFCSDASPLFLWRKGLHRNRNVFFPVNCC